MKANSKKLLSLLIAVALVLSMTPVISLQAEAAEFDPATTVCDACGTAPEGGWTEIPAGSAAVTLSSGHYYLSGRLSGTSGTSASAGLVNVSAGATVCLHSNGNQIKNSRSNTTSNAPKSAAIRVAGTLNYFGTGEVVNNSGTTDYPSVVIVSGGDANIYGGTFSNFDPANYVAAGYAATDNGDGTWTVAEGAAAPALPTTCPCGATGLTANDWTQITSSGISSSVTTHNHYYVAADTTITGTTNSIQLGADQCLYIPEGKTLTNYGRIRARSGKSMHIFGDGNYIHADGETTYSMFDSSSTGYLYIHGGNWSENETNGIAPFSGTRYRITGGTFNFDPSAYVADGYQATKSGSTWTVAEYVAPTLPTNCPMCGDENVTWTEVTAATGDTGFAASGHYALANNITGGAKRVFSVPADMEVCLHLNGKNITGTSATNGTVALQTLGTLRVMGEGIVSTPNVAPNAEGVTSWGVITANGENAVVEIYGGTYVDNASRGRAVRSTGTMTIYGGSFCEDVSGLVAEGKWALPAGQTWTVEVLSAAAIIKADSYKTYATAAEAVAAYTEGCYIKIGNAEEIALTGGNYFVDANFNTVAVTGTGTLNPAGEGTYNDLTGLTVIRDAVNPITGDRFLLVGNEAYDLELKLSQVVLRAGTTSDNMGLYYKATIDADEDLASKIEAYGAVFSLKGAPGDDFTTNTTNGNVYTMVDGPIDVSAGAAVVNSGSIFGIMTEETTDKNAEYGEMKIYADAYIALDLDGDGAEEYIMASNNASHSLKDVMVAINGMENVPEVVKTFYSHWAEFGMGAWAAELDKIAA